MISKKAPWTHMTLCEPNLMGEIAEIPNILDKDLKQKDTWASLSG